MHHVFNAAAATTSLMVASMLEGPQAGLGLGTAGVDCCLPASGVPESAGPQSCGIIFSTGIPGFIHRC